MLSAEISTMNSRGRAPKIRVRPSQASDGVAMWHLADRSTLDTNSPYAYVHYGDQFSSTCRVAINDDGAVVGFVLAHLLPKRPNSLFIWQIGVAEEARGLGIASEMLDSLWADTADVSFLEATVTPSNTASDRLFRRFAQQHAAELETSLIYGEALFPAGTHEAELRYRIGPIAIDS
ncbi:MAG: diaminobutyrate acetyltransferase [Acidimicrobiia bacterium]